MTKINLLEDLKTYFGTNLNGINALDRLRIDKVLIDISSQLIKNPNQIGYPKINLLNLDFKSKQVLESIIEKTNYTLKLGVRPNEIK